MTGQLEGKRIVIAGSQKIDEMSEIIERQGGTPLVRPLQGLDYPEDTAVDADLHRLLELRPDWIIFTTGIGYEVLRKSAERLALVSEYEEALKHAKVASRGYRAYAFLKNIGVTPAIYADDGTIRNVIGKLDEVDFTGLRVWIQLHGQPVCEISEYMKTRGPSEIVTCLPYIYKPPKPETLATLISELQQGAVDAICFTTGVQVGYLFDYARETGCEREILDAFNRKVLAVAVGKVTAETMRERGIRRVIVPELERMGGMIVELARYYETMAV
jgi:uroporphyrinogen-III synthase